MNNISCLIELLYITALLLFYYMMRYIIYQLVIYIASACLFPYFRLCIFGDSSNSNFKSSLLF